MTQRNDGGVAFPACNEANMNQTMGMTLRDWFAGQALGALASDIWNEEDAKKLPTAAYLIADAMLKAREAPTDD